MTGFSCFLSYTDFDVTLFAGGLVFFKSGSVFFGFRVLSFRVLVVAIFVAFDATLGFIVMSMTLEKLC